MTAPGLDQSAGRATAARPRERRRLDLNSIFRAGILAVTSNPLVSRAVRRYGMRLGHRASSPARHSPRRFPSYDRSIRAVCAPTLRFSAKGSRTTPRRAVVDEYKADLDRIAAESLQTNVALKLTHLGLDLDPELAYGNVAEVVAHAATHGNFIRIDMEESARVDDTLRIYRRLRSEGHDNVGTVLQSYLYRTPDDLESLLPLSPNLRLVKGAYLEPASIAYPRKAEVDRAYIELAERMLLDSAFTAIATHDERIIDHVIAFTQRNGIGNDRFEFQMLYGVRPQYQIELARAGHRVLIATPLRSALVPLPHAPPRGTPGEPCLVRQQPDKAVADHPSSPASVRTRVLPSPRGEAALRTKYGWQA